MSQSFNALELKDEDARKILAAKMHLGEQNCNYQMQIRLQKEPRWRLHHQHQKNVAKNRFSR